MLSKLLTVWRAGDLKPALRMRQRYGAYTLLGAGTFYNIFIN
jgi:hypothetical protein